ncbi:MAG: c-type cytochrome [Desulfobacterales bacterium]|nr:c-type cytochrome [Desulfobacterales bacterium]
MRKTPLYSFRLQWLVPAALFLVFGFLISGLLAPAWAHGWKSPPDAALVKNPVPLSPEVLAGGKALFKDFCSRCHGKDARGGEPGEYTMVPPDLVSRLASHSHGDFFWKINRGRGDMPGFAEDLSSEEIWTIIHHIDQLRP